MNTYAGSPAFAAAAAVAPARLPVDAQASASNPKSSAFAVASATARSLNQSVGLRESSLRWTRATPSAAASGSDAMSGVDRRRAPGRVAR